MKLQKMKLQVYCKWEKSRNNSFTNLLEFNPNAKVLDIGCGNGEFTLKAKNKIGSSKVYGIEIYDPFIKEAEKKGISIIKHDLNKLPYPIKDESFDVIISNQVIEHLYYPVQFMKEIYKILKPGGYAVISTENLSSWDNIIALLLGYSPFYMEFDGGLRLGNPLSLHYKEEYKEKCPPHTRILTWKTFEDMSNHIGFKLEKLVGSGHLLFKLGEKIDKKHCRFMTIKIRKCSKDGRI